MADSWNGAPATWTTGEVVAASKMNTEVRDRMDALRAGLTDSSADSDIRLAPKEGTLALRPLATAGSRFYRTTDTLETFHSNGTAWRHAGGAGAYDDFRRANNSNPNASNPYQPSGSPWTEESGDWSITSDLLGLTSATSANITLNTSSLLDRSYTVNAGIFTQATQASIDAGIIFKYVDTSNLLYARLIGTALEIRSVIATVNTLLSTVPFSPAANSAYHVSIQVYGKAVVVQMVGQASFSTFTGTRHDNITNAAFAAATKVGFRTPNISDRFSQISVQF